MPQLFDFDMASRSMDQMKFFPIYSSKTMDGIRELPLPQICLLVLASWLCFEAARTVIKAYGSPLSDTPGPWIAKFTRLWLMWAINTRSWDKINIRLHRKYGPVVRISPNEYSIDDPDAARIIYRTRDELVKGQRYEGWALPNVEPMVFTERGIERHTQRRKEVNGLYLNTSIVNMEKPLDEVIKALFGRLSGFAETGEVIEMFDWLHYFAFDAIGVFTFGRTFGFLQKGGDIQELMETIHNFSRYGAVIGVFAEWHPVIFKIMSALAPGGMVGLEYLTKFSDSAIAELGGKGHEREEGATYLLSSLLAKHQNNPNVFTMDDVHHHVLPNVVGGAETTGITLSAAMYFLWKNPHTLAKLRQELDTKRAAGDFNDIVTVKDTTACPYLQAVIKETLRLHPGNGLGLTRLVPKGGLNLAGRYFPEGTEVNINAYAAHANRSVFGEDTESFRPERWLTDQETLNRMDNYLLTFGKGTRTCMGKHIALMEVSRLVPELAMRFDFEFEDPAREWTVYNDWFMKQEGIRVRVKTRKTGSL
ncbi:hypothetical protein MMC18_002655 [Xylographa bjoerkii]|nr:hypothetical protein [Xylographa bjoerkii]